MRSASSSTSTATLARLTRPISVRSLRRPGVAMRSEGFLRCISLIWLHLEAPPYTHTERMPTAAPNVEATTSICIASSRVGASTSAWTPPPRGLRAIGPPLGALEAARGKVGLVLEGLDAREHREEETQRLAGAGARHTDDVAACMADGPGLCLDRRRLREAGLQQLGVEALVERGLVKVQDGLGDNVLPARDLGPAADLHLVLLTEGDAVLGTGRGRDLVGFGFRAQGAEGHERRRAGHGRDPRGPSQLPRGRHCQLGLLAGFTVFVLLLRGFFLLVLLVLLGALDLRLSGRGVLGIGVGTRALLALGCFVGCHCDFRSWCWF